MAVRLGNLALNITLGEGAFEASANKVSRSFNRAVGRIRKDSKLADVAIGSVVSSMRGIGGAARLAGKAITYGLGAVAGLAAGAIAALDQVADKYTDLNKRANEYGLTVERLQLIELVAGKLGADADRLADFYKDAQEKIGIAINEASGEGFDALKLLGLDPKGFKSIDDAIGPIIDKLRQLPEASRRAIQGMFAGVGADLPTEHLGILRLIVEEQEKVAETFGGMFGDAATVQRALDAGVALGNISSVVGVLKDKVLTSEWMTQAVNFAERFALGLDNLDSAGINIGNVVNAVQADIKTLGVYARDIFVWAFAEAGKSLARSIQDALSSTRNHDLIDEMGLGPAFDMLNRKHTSPVAASMFAASPVPGVGNFQTDDLVMAVAEQGSKQVQAIDKLGDRMIAAAMPVANPTGTTVDIKAQENAEKVRIAAEKAAAKDKEKAEKAAKRAVDAMEREIESRKMALADQFAWVAETGLTSGGDAALEQLGNMIKQRLLTAFADSFVNALPSLTSGKGIGGAIGTFLGGFNTGGSGMLPGSGGPDSKLYSFKGTPGEHFSVQPQGSSAGSTQFNVYNNFDGMKVGDNVTQADLQSMAQFAEQGSVNAMIKLRREGKF